MTRSISICRPMTGIEFALFGQSGQVHGQLIHQRCL